MLFKEEKCAQRKVNEMFNKEILEQIFDDIGEIDFMVDKAIVKLKELPQFKERTQRYIETTSR